MPRAGGRRGARGEGRGAWARLMRRNSTVVRLLATSKAWTQRAAGCVHTAPHAACCGLQAEHAGLQAVCAGCRLRAQVAGCSDLAEQERREHEEEEGAQ